MKTGAERTNMPVRSVHITEQLDQFVEGGVAPGQFNDASHAADEGLRLLEQNQVEDRKRADWLHGAIQEGIDAIEHGDYTVLNTSEDIEALMTEIHREVMAEVNAEPQRA